MIGERTLNDLLAELFDTKERSVTIVVAAGMIRRLVDFKDVAQDNWSNILSEAEKQGKLQALVDVACKNYENKKEELLYLLGKWPSLMPKEERSVIPSRPEEHARPDPDVHIGRELHWDRELLASCFVEMIRQAGNTPWRIMGLQGPKEADLDSLVARFEEMCRKVKIPEPARYPRIFTTVLLHSGLATPSRLALEILDNLAMNARDAAVGGERARLEQGFDEIEKSSRGTGMESLSDIQLSRKLTKCLQDVTQNSTLVLLLQRFEELNEGPAKWLRDEWLTADACRIERLVVVITGETLKQLTKLEKKGIYCPDGLPQMTWQDFLAWARERDGFNFDWFTEDLAKKYYEWFDGNPQKYVELLKGFKVAITAGVRLPFSEV